VTTLEDHTRGVRDAGRKLLAPYLTGGITADWTDHLRAYADAGADLAEIGLPFSDPTMDGPTIAAASERALARGTTVDRILDDVSRAAIGIPLVAMAYAQHVVRRGADGFCARLAAAGFAGLIVPDAPVDEIDPIESAARAAGLDLVLLAAPVSTLTRLAEIGTRARGFVYAVGVMGTTGARDQVADTARPLVEAVRRATDRPVLLGFGVSRPAHATEIATFADGVVVGAALMRKVLDGAGPARLGADVAALRRGLDECQIGGR